MFTKDINLSDLNDKNRLKDFLKKNDLVLDLDNEVDESIGIFAGSQLIASCSVQGKVIKGFAVNEEYREQNLTAILLGEMIKKLFSKGIHKSFIFTKKICREKFESLGYRFIAEGGDAVLLECGFNGIDSYIDYLRKFISRDTVNGCIIMNCNPFTLGHRYLIETASLKCDILYIFVVQEDKSLFPFIVRKDLIIRGTKDLTNVVIIDGGDYIISSATFPGYFIRKLSDKIQMEALLDIDIFTKYIAPVLNITKRFAGTEPLDEVTGFYNKIMSTSLPEQGIEFVEIERKMIENEVISASKVRNSIKCNDAGIDRLLPETTINFLKSPEGQKIIEKIKKSYSPH